MSIPEGPTFLLVPHSDTAIPGTIVRRRPDGSILPVPPPPTPVSLWDIPPYALSGGALGVLQHPVAWPMTPNSINVGVNNQDHAVACILQEGMHLSDIGVISTNATAGNARAAIYSSRASDYYPDALQVESALLDIGTAGVKMTAINWTVPATGLYWGMINGAPSAAQMAGSSGNALPAIFGYGATGSKQTGIWNVRALAAFPDPWPAGGIFEGGFSVPLVFMRIDSR